VDCNVLFDEIANVLEVLRSENSRVVEILVASVSGVVFAVTRSRLTVIKRVFDGGDGVMSGGKSERSSDSGVRGVELEGEERRLEMVPVLSGGSEDFVEFMMSVSCRR
jgi:hypothetical protein